MSESLYFDSSAIVKLCVVEPESRALAAVLGPNTEAASSALSRVEVGLALRRANATSDALRRAQTVLSRIVLISIDEPILSRAASLDPPDLRALDAIHLATALDMRMELGAIVTYDARLARAAERAGLLVRSPR